MNPAASGRHERAGWTVHVLVAGIGFATMVLELTQTRVLSALFYNHVVYLTVTIALLGFGVSGVLVSLLARKGFAISDRSVVAAVAAFVMMSLLGLRLASFTPALFGEQSFFAKLLFSYLVLACPFLFAGASLGLIFMRHGRSIHTLYFVDLSASALGAIAFTFLLRPLGADGIVWFAVGSAAAALALFGMVRRAGVALLLVTLVAVVGSAWQWREGLLSLRPEAYKVTIQPFQRPTARLEHAEWTPIARIEVLSDPVVDLIKRRADAGASHFKLLSQDGDAFTALPGLPWRRSLLREPEADQPISAQNLGYVIRPAPADSLIIGVGGGFDIVSARAFGARRITGVELNPATVDLVRGPYADYLEWPRWLHVDLVLGEGRHYVARSRRTFDTIVMSAVDTFSALSAGAFVLSENYLYTVEALQDYLRALKPGGVVTIFRWLFRYPRESLRLANLYVGAAERLGIATPSQSIMIVAVDWGWSYRWAATLMKREPFTPEEVRTILGRIRGQAPHMAAVYVPDVFPASEQTALEAEVYSVDAQYLAPARDAFARLLRAPSAAERARFVNGYAYNITPVYDDRPFFFEYHKLTEFLRTPDYNEHGARGVIVHYVLYFLLAATGLVATVAILGPLLVLEREGIRQRGIGFLVGFFASLGFGFMFVEMGVIQRLNLYLGHPIYSLAVVLAGLLLFTGLGSYRAGQSGLDYPCLLRRAMIGVAVSVTLWLAASYVVIPWTLSWPLWGRIAVALLSLLPVGLMLGVPFATGLRYLEEYDARLIPWAWGINGLTSVMGSILAIILAMRIGFTAVVLLAAATYLVGYGTVRAHFKRS